MKFLLTMLMGLFLPLSFHAEAAEPVKFSDALYAKFHHARCLQCHQFNSRKNNGRAYFSHRNRYLCDKCHTQFVTGLPPGEWMAPAGSSMDYTGLNARDTCMQVKRNVGSGDINAKLLHHLEQDLRVKWALETGMTPMGKFPTVPGGYKAWMEDVKAWARDGMLCE
jgi:hypothetical protein